MRIFENLNEHGNECPICGTKKEGKCVLVGVDGTEDRKIMQALQVHVDCIELRLTKGHNYQVLYMKIEKGNI